MLHRAYSYGDSSGLSPDSLFILQGIALQKPDAWEWYAEKERMSRDVLGSGSYCHPIIKTHLFDSKSLDLYQANDETEKMRLIVNDDKLPR